MEVASSIDEMEVAGETNAAIQIFDFDVESGNADEIVIGEVLSVLRPHWKRDDIQREDLALGFLNHMICYRRRDEEEPKDAITVRIFKRDDSLDEFINKDIELAMMQLGAHSGFFPPLLALFNNGVVYKYAPGRHPLPADLRDPNFARGLMKSLVRLHHVDPRVVPIKGRRGEDLTPDYNRTMMDKLWRYVQMMEDQYPDVPIPDSVVADCVPLTDVRAELTVMQSLLEELELPLVTSHNDLHYFNIIYNEHQGSAFILDHELCARNYAAFDLVTLLNGYMYRNTWPLMNYGEQRLDTQTLEMWARCYLEEKKKLAGSGDRDVHDTDVHQLLLEMNIVEAFVHLYWIIVKRWLYFTAPHLGVPDEMFAVSKEWYKKKSSELPRLRARYLEHRG